MVYAEIVSEHESRAKALRTILQGQGSIVIISTATAITVVEGGAMLADKFILAGRKREREEGREEGRKEMLVKVDQLEKRIAELEGDSEKPA